MMTESIRISEAVKQRLKDRGRKDDSYSMVIEKALDIADKAEQNAKRG